MTMTNEATLLAPLAVLACGAVLLLLAIAVKRSQAVAVTLTLASLAASLAAVPAASQRAGAFGASLTPLLRLDRYALTYSVLLVLAALVVTLLMAASRHDPLVEQEEAYLLLLLATLGAAVLAASTHFASFFLGLELLSVSLYGMIGYRRDDSLGLEAAIKYLILAGAGSAFLLLGMALVYAATGTLELAGVAARLSAPSASTLGSLGFALMLLAVGFKLAVVPFHMWTPDVYQGAPTPTAAFVATVSKGAVVALLVRYATSLGTLDRQGLTLALAIIAGGSMVIGNLLALEQRLLKRLLAYSSIAHLGTMLVAVLAGGAIAVEAVTYYLAAYFATMLAAFGVIVALEADSEAPVEIESVRGLLWSRPLLGVTMTVSLLSLAGMPITAGFVAKVYVIVSAVGEAMWGLALLLVAGSAIGIFYYLRLVAVMAEPVARAARSRPSAVTAAVTGTTLCLLIAVILALGVYPSSFETALRALLVGWPPSSAWSRVW
jgi:NADH-quinone oxidoreductase subunit N